MIAVCSGVFIRVRAGGVQRQRNTGAVLVKISTVGWQISRRLTVKLQSGSLHGKILTALSPDFHLPLAWQPELAQPTERGFL